MRALPQSLLTPRPQPRRPRTWSTNKAAHKYVLCNTPYSVQVRTQALVPTAQATAVQPLDIFRQFEHRVEVDGGTTQASVRRLTRSTLPERTNNNTTRVDFVHLFRTNVSVCAGMGHDKAEASGSALLFPRKRSHSVLCWSWHKFRGPEPQYMHGKGGDNGVGEKEKDYTRWG